MPTSFPLRSVRLLLSLCVMAFASGCDTDEDDDNGIDPSVEWELVGPEGFAQEVHRGNIYANNGNVYVGYWSHVDDLPHVDRYNAADQRWEAYGSGLAGAVNAAGTTPLNSASPLLYRQDGATSYLLMNRDQMDTELMLFKSDGNAWQQLPSVPLNLLPGGFQGMLQTEFDMDAVNGKVYVALRNTTAAEDYLCLFIYAGGNWSLNNERLSHPAIPGTFSYEGYFTNPMVKATSSGKVFLSYMETETTDTWYAQVASSDGGGWVQSVPYGALPMFGDWINMALYDMPGSERVVFAPYQNDNDFHAYLLNGANYTELNTSDISRNFTFLDCADCLAMKTWDNDGLMVKMYRGGTWTRLGDTDFRSGGAFNSGRASDEIAYDASTGTIYVLYTSTMYELSVRSHRLD